MKVLFHHRCGDWLRRRFAELAAEGLEVAVCDGGDEAGFRRLLADTEVLWHVLTPVTADHLAAAPRLRLVQKIGVGVNTIDLEAAAARGVAVCNMPGTNSRAVAEMTLLLMLACLRRLVVFDRLTRRGEGWDWPLSLEGELGELAGRTVGLAGMGAVPRLLAPVLEAMGAEVIYTARHRHRDVPWRWCEKSELLARAEILSLHVPLTPETAGWLDVRAMAAMRPGAILINTARGGLVDEAALLRHLASGRIAAAGLDVFAEEPVAPDHPLLAMENVVCAPHVAWFTTGTVARSLEVAVENCRRLADGRPLLHRVV